MTDKQLEVEMTFTVGQRSVAGKKAKNEDTIGIRIPTGSLLVNKGAIAVIADGVSASEAGKEASETCVHNFLSDYYSTPDTWNVKKSSSQVLTALNRWLFSQGRQFSDAKKGYISTLSCVIFKSQIAHVFHVGDSRIYRLRGGELEQLTRDHTTRVNKNQTYLSRAMGLDVQLEVDYRSIDLEPNDLFFLSTDGIHDTLKHNDLQIRLSQLAENFSDRDFEICCEGLIQQALELGSNDNLSCQILRLNCLPTPTIDEVGRKLTKLPFPPELWPGLILDGYRVERELHTSKRSQIYLVTDVESGESYCMKTPSINYDDDLIYIEHFILESWIGCQIKNPHIVRVINANRTKTCLYYLTEFIDGITLTQWIKENPQTAIQKVIYITDQIVKG